MTTIQEFIKLVQSGAQPVVQFQAGIGEKESYAEPGMRARALRVQERNDEIVSIVFGFAEFDAFNLPFETANYYDDKGKPTLTARKAGFYNAEDSIYFDLAESLTTTFQVVADDRVQLFESYTASGVIDTYVGWLEQQLLAVAAANVN
jgi:hypothetical protein